MKRRILIVEDEAIPALELEMRLGRWGYEVTRTESRGQAAIDAASAECPDLIVMDIVLADDISGIDAADAIQAICDVPVLFLTAIEYRASGIAPPNHRRLALSKPYNPEQLRDAISTLLR